MVKKRKLPILWDSKAVESLKDIYNYIKKDSPLQAKRVKNALLKLARSLNDFPEKYSSEKYLADEAENFRSITKWRYKLIYEITDKEIIIIMLFHTSQDPGKMKKR